MIRYTVALIIAACFGGEVSFVLQKYYTVAPLLSLCIGVSTGGLLVLWHEILTGSKWAKECID